MYGFFRQSNRKLLSGLVTLKSKKIDFFLLFWNESQQNQ